MRLLNTSTLELRDFTRQKLPAYAILSHQWTEDEVSYQDFRALVARGNPYADAFEPADGLDRLKDVLRSSGLSGLNNGFLKILLFCTVARRDSFAWVWVDTCCINKESSAELSESINSMYKWYQEAKTCYAYLVDVDNVDGFRLADVMRQDSEPVPDGNGRHDDDNDGNGDGNHETEAGGTEGSNRARRFSYGSAYSFEQDSTGIRTPSEYEADYSGISFVPRRLEQSRYFRRGFTLQEMLAPLNVRFYNRHWNFVGNKFDLASRISDATGIDAALLGSSNPTVLLKTYSIAERMSWAADRETTRVEDIAYSLLGLFGIHMSLLYGEGENAFLRLQKKMLKTSTDETIFAWDPGRVPGYGDFHGLLAPHPKAFVRSRKIVPLEMVCDPVSITSRGVGFSVFNHPHLSRSTLRLTLPLNCRRDGEIVGIPLAKLGGRWYRARGPGRLMADGMYDVGRNSTMPDHSFDHVYREAMYVSITPTPAPATDHGVGLFRDLNINGDLDERNVDADEVEFEAEPVDLFLALRFRTHMVPWRTLRNSVDKDTADRMVRSHPEITNIRNKLDRPVEMTDTGKEVVVGPRRQIVLVRPVPQPADAHVAHEAHEMVA